MKYRAIVAQKRTRAELLESLRMGAEDMPATQVPFEPGGVMTVVEVTEPEWPLETVPASLHPVLS